MNKILQVNIFSCGHRAYRFPFTVKSFEELIQCKNIDKIRIVIHAESQMINFWNSYLNTKKPNIECQLVQYSNSDYLTRVLQSQKTECEYSCKLDDDVLMSRHVWDFMTDNIGIISDAHPVIAPILTNGMPSTELFVQDFLNPEDIEIAHSMFLRGVIPTHLWDLDYTEINLKIKSMKIWNDREYWDFVTTADTKWEVLPIYWFYCLVRGVHPSRFSSEYNLFIAERIIKNKEKFFQKQNYYFEEYDGPYFTNNTFISKTQYWRDTLPMFGTPWGLGWDEGQLTMRMKMDNASILYVRNGFGIHMAYGMTDNAQLIEQTYIRNFCHE